MYSICMEENIPSQNNTSSNPMKFVIPVVVILAIIAGAFLFMQKKSTTPVTNDATAQPTVAAMQQEASPEAGSPSGAMAATEMTVDVVGGNFAFDKKEIRVKKGQKVTVNFTNKEGFHDFVIDELNVKTSRIAAGKTESVIFTADKVGTFEYYCSIGNHRQMGMKGNLIVE